MPLTIALGITFSILLALPPALAIRSAGLPWIPFGVAALLPGVVAAAILAYIVTRFVFGAGLPEPAGPIIKPQAPGEAPASRRLADAVAQLEHLENERIRRRDCRYDKRVEERIIWNELLDLELQEIDEQLSRMSGSPHS